eukprot:942360_1
MGDQRIPQTVQGCEQICQGMNVNWDNVRFGRTMVLYRAEEHRKLELERSIIVEKVTLENDLRDLINQNPAQMENPEPYYVELAETIHRANAFQLESAVANQARQLLDDFIESRIDPESKQIIEHALASREKAQLEYAVQLAAQYGYKTKACRACKKLLTHMNRIDEECLKALVHIEKKAMDVIVAAANECGYRENETIDYFRELLRLPTDKLLQQQMRAAVAAGDTNSQILLSIKIKDLFFTGNLSLFNVNNYEKMKLAEYWASEYMLGLMGGPKLRESHMKWTDHSIHASLMSFPKGKQFKSLSKDAKSLFRFTMIYMGDKKPDSKSGNNLQVGRKILSMCFDKPLLRNELFVQLMKQLSANPKQGSIKKGWELMVLALSAFPPQKDFENYLEMFLRQKAPSGEKKRFIVALHTIVFSRNRQYEVPSFDEMEMIIAGRTIRSAEFSDKSPPASPSWEDLLQSWEAREEEEEPLFTLQNTAKVKDFRVRMTSKAVSPKLTVASEPMLGWGRQQRESTFNHQKEYSGPWIELIDPDSGYPYYENTESGETLWDKPAEMP